MAIVVVCVSLVVTGLDYTTLEVARGCQATGGTRRDG
jgi:hypothetical protein